MICRLPTFRFAVLTTMAVIAAILIGFHVAKIEWLAKDHRLGAALDVGHRQITAVYGLTDQLVAFTSARRSVDRAELAERIADRMDEIVTYQRILAPVNLGASWLPTSDPAREAELRMLHAAAEPGLYGLESALAPILADPDSERAMQAARRIQAGVVSGLIPALLRPLQVYRDYQHDMHDAVLVWEQALLLLVLGAIAVEAALVSGPFARHADLQGRRLLAAESELNDRALTDVVTGLPSEHALAGCLDRLPEGMPLVAILFEVAPAMVAGGTRNAISPGIASETGARLRALALPTLFCGHAGEERYCALLDGRRGDAHLAEVVARLETLVSDPVSVRDQRFRLILSGGIARTRGDTTRPELIAHARVALDSACAANGGIAEYTADLGRAAEDRRRLARELRTGIDADEIEAFFQPQIDLSTGGIAGFEALARWRHPDRGMMSPGAFLPLAQETGLDEPLGEAMLRQALRALRAWDERGFAVGSVAVNLAQSQLHNPRLVDLIKWELDATGVDPERLCVEILETIHVDNDDDRILHNLRALTALGVQLDLDDFGTGATSIIGIRRFGATRVKIDRSFVQDVHQRPDNQALIRTIVGMAEGLGVTVLGEGVECPEEATMLGRLGCRYLQGYLLAKPMPLEQSFAWLADHGRSAPAWQADRARAG